MKEYYNYIRYFFPKWQMLIYKDQSMYRKNKYKNEKVYAAILSRSRPSYTTLRFKSKFVYSNSIYC